MKAPEAAAANELALTGEEHVLGDPQSKLTLLEYGDDECPQCMLAEPEIRHHVAAHTGPLCFVFRHHPQWEIHPHAELAAEAAEAAAAQGRFSPITSTRSGCRSIAAPAIAVACGPPRRSC